jgi:hypothetical protein
MPEHWSGDPLLACPLNGVTGLPEIALNDVAFNREPSPPVANDIPDLSG